MKNMEHAKYAYWHQVWHEAVKNLKVEGLAPSSIMLVKSSEAIQLGMSYHGKEFTGELPSDVLDSYSPATVHSLMIELVEQICEWMAKELSDMVNLLPKDWDGDKRPEKPSPLSTWENLFKEHE